MNFDFVSAQEAQMHDQAFVLTQSHIANNVCVC